MLTTVQSSTTTLHLHSFKLALAKKAVTELSGCYPLCRTQVSNLVCMCKCSLIPRPKTTVINWSGSETSAHAKSHVDPYKHGWYALFPW